MKIGFSESAGMGSSIGRRGKEREVLKYTQWGVWWVGAALGKPWERRTWRRKGAECLCSEEGRC